MNCSLCEGFHWVPAGKGPGWYRRDWRLLLDPTVSWLPCRRCRSAAPMAALHDSLARMLSRRLIKQVPRWRWVGGWAQGATADGQRLWRHGDVLCVEPGPLCGFDGWLLVSDRSLSRGLDYPKLSAQLARAGLPRLPLVRPEDSADA